MLLYSQEHEFRMKEVQVQDVGTFIFYIYQLISALFQEISQDAKLSLLPMDEFVFIYPQVI